MRETTTTKLRQRRTPEQMIANLEKEIERVKQRVVAKEPKGDLDVQEARKLARAVQKARRKAKDVEIKAALKAAQQALGGYLETRGIAAPRPLRHSGITAS